MNILVSRLGFIKTLFGIGTKQPFRYWPFVDFTKTKILWEVATVSIIYLISNLKWTTPNQRIPLLIFFNRKKNKNFDTFPKKQFFKRKIFSEPFERTDHLLQPEKKKIIFHFGWRYFLYAFPKARLEKAIFLNESNFL